MIRRFAYNTARGISKTNFSVPFRPLSSDISGSHKVPDESFNPEVENDREFLDIATSLHKGGLENLTTIKDPLTWDMIQAARSKPIKLSTPQTDQIDDMDESLPLATSKLALEVFMNTELGEHLKEFRNGTIIPNEFFNSTIPWQKSKEFAEKPLADFIPFSAPEKYSHSTQGRRTCPGKLQRRGKTGNLQCHKIDLDALNHMDVMTLRNYISEDSEILGRKSTGLCAKCQRQVAKTIKRARNFGILTHLGNFEIQEVRPDLKREDFHEALNADVIKSKTIIP